MRFIICFLFFFAILGIAADIRIGIIGTDTSHVVAFSKILNDPRHPDFIPGARIVAAFKGGSKDIESSRSRVDQYATELARDWKVEIVPDIATLLTKVDAVLLESVDGRTHLEQARLVIAAGKLLFIDKPLSSTLEDAVEIAKLAKARGVGWFSSSSLRWAKSLAPLQQPNLKGAIVWGPGPLDTTLFRSQGDCRWACKSWPGTFRRVRCFGWLTRLSRLAGWPRPRQPATYQASLRSLTGLPPCSRLFWAASRTANISKVSAVSTGALPVWKNLTNSLTSPT